MTKDQILAASRASGGMLAMIPSVVLMDEALSLSACMLYGIITWKCNENACCWATNRMLGEALRLSPKRISSLLSALEAQGHIEIEIIRDPETKQILRRNIYPIVKSSRGLITPIPENKDTSTQEPDPIPENEDTSTQIQGDPILKNAEEKYKYKNINIKPPIAPPDVWNVLEDYAQGDQELIKAMTGFLEKRSRKKKPLDTVRAAHLLINKLDKLSGGDRALKIAILDQSTLNGWTGVFELHGETPAMPPGSSGAASRVVEEEGVFYL